MACQTGDFAAARVSLAECLSLRAALRSDHEAPLVFCTLATIALGEGDPARAARMLAAAEATFARLELQPEPVTRERLARDSARVRAMLEAGEFARAWSAGTGARLEQTLAPDGAWKMPTL
jgi:hypothetical protein